MSEACHCKCGYSCGGPGVCELFSRDAAACINAHFVKDCGHDFNGPMTDMGDGCHSVVCTKCGVSAMGHDMLCGP